MAPSSRLRRGLVVLASAGALCATGWVAWFASLAARLNRQPLGGIVSEALEFALLAWAWSAAMAFVLYLTIPKPSRVDVVRGALRTSATAVWFAPATILLSAFSPYAMVAAIVLVVSTTRLLYSQWRQVNRSQPDEAAATPDPDLFEVPSPAPLVKQLAPALAASAGMQSGFLAILMGYPLLASALFAMCGAILTLLSLVLGVWEDPRPASLPRSVLGVVMTLLLAAGLTVGGLAVRGRSQFSWDFNHHPRPGLLESARAWLRHQFYGEVPQAEEAGTKIFASHSGDSQDLTDEIFPGVILWPEVQPHTVLVPPLPALPGGLTNLPGRIPLSIPFAGEYWMFKSPNVRPPLDAHIQRGTPSRVSFRTTDQAPLNMVARYRFEEPIALTCCSQIRLEVLNADRYPGTVRLELLAADTDSRPERVVSLGSARVASLPDLARDPVVPVPETLDFFLPGGGALRAFDEIRVVFHRDLVRIEKSARVSIERFLFVPR